MSDALPCIAIDLLTHGDGVVVVFGLMFAAIFVGGVWGLVGVWLDALGRHRCWLSRSPWCSSCRRTNNRPSKDEVPRG